MTFDLGLFFTLHTKFFRIYNLLLVEKQCFIAANVLWDVHLEYALTFFNSCIVSVQIENCRLYKFFSLIKIFKLNLCVQPQIHVNFSTQFIIKFEDYKILQFVPFNLKLFVLGWSFDAHIIFLFLNPICAIHRTQLS